MTLALILAAWAGVLLGYLRGRRERPPVRIPRAQGDEERAIRVGRAVLKQAEDCAFQSSICGAGVVVSHYATIALPNRPRIYVKLSSEPMSEQQRSDHV